jgi:hypothetical protein
MFCKIKRQKSEEGRGGEREEVCHDEINRECDPPKKTLRWDDNLVECLIVIWQSICVEDGFSWQACSSGATQ